MRSFAGGTYGVGAFRHRNDCRSLHSLFLFVAAWCRFSIDGVCVGRRTNRRGKNCHLIACRRHRRGSSRESRPKAAGLGASCRSAVGLESLFGWLAFRAASCGGSRTCTRRLRL